MLIDYSLMQTLILVENKMQRKNDVVPPVLKLSAAAVYHASFCRPHAVKVKQKKKKRMGGWGRGEGAQKQDWVRLIVACRGQPLSSPNIIFRFSIRLQPSDSECRQCCYFYYSCTRCNMFLQFNLAARPQGGFTYCLDPRTNHKPNKYQGLCCLGSGWRLRGLDVHCCLSDYTMITTRCVLLCYVYTSVQGHLGDLQCSSLSKFKLLCW